MASHPAASLASLDDVVLAGRVVRGDHGAFEALMRRHNGRLFRVARAVLRDDAEAEDALQDAYLDAYRHMADFRGAAQIGTWLARIVVNRALMRLRRRKRDRVVVPLGTLAAPEVDAEPEIAEPDTGDETLQSAPGLVLRGELRRLLERRIDDLPMAFRTVFVMRDVEDMTVQETAECLAIPTATVRTRLFRARALLREALARDLDAATADVFGFAGERCDRIVAGVLARLPGGADGGRAGRCRVEGT